MSNTNSESKDLLMPETDGKPYIFISYKHDEWAKVSEVIAQLKRRGFRVWYDLGIQSTEQWRTTLRDRVEKCSFFLAFISPSYIAPESVWCFTEILHASMCNKPICGVYLEPTRLNETYKSFLHDTQNYLNFYEMRKETFYREMLQNKAAQPCLGEPLSSYASLDLESTIDSGIRCGHHFILSMDMMQNKYTDVLAQTVEQSIRTQPAIQDLVPLTLEAPPLHDEDLLHQITSPDPDFFVSCPFRRMFSLAVNKSMPEEDADARVVYLKTFCDILNKLFPALHSNGITDVHMFYRGPLALAPFVGQAMFNDFRIFYYHARRNGDHFENYYRVGAQSRL